MTDPPHRIEAQADAKAADIDNTSQTLPQIPVPAPLLTSEHSLDESEWKPPAVTAEQQQQQEEGEGGCSSNHSSMSMSLSRIKEKDDEHDGRRSSDESESSSSSHDTSSDNRANTNTTPVTRTIPNNGNKKKKGVTFRERNSIREISDHRRPSMMERMFYSKADIEQFKLQKQREDMEELQAEKQKAERERRAKKTERKLSKEAAKATRKERIAERKALREKQAQLHAQLDQLEEQHDLLQSQQQHDVGTATISDTSDHDIRNSNDSPEDINIQQLRRCTQEMESLHGSLQQLQAEMDALEQQEQPPTHSESRSMATLETTTTTIIATKDDSHLQLHPPPTPPNPPVHPLYQEEVALLAACKTFPPSTPQSRAYDTIMAPSLKMAMANLQVSFTKMSTTTTER